MWKNKVWAKIRLYAPGGIIAGVFAVLAGRIAFARQFPLPYDEGYHFGLTNLYVHHLNPFLPGQPLGADPYGAVARDPSYLYQYLLSYPLHLLQALHFSTLDQVWALRAVSIGLGLWTLYLVYRLARRLSVSKPWAYLATFALAVTPVFYDASAQINYDNLMLPLVLLTALCVVSVSRRMNRGVVSMPQLAYLTVLMILASLVKYSFLPIVVGVVAYLGFVAFRALGVRKLVRAASTSFTTLGRASQVALVVGVLVAGVLGFQRYGVNMLTYHTPHPQCDAVLSVNECQQYAPWARNYQLHQTASARPLYKLTAAHFSVFWVRQMVTQVFSIVQSKNGGIQFLPYKALLVLGTFIGFLGIVFASVLSNATLRRRWYALGLLALSYLAVLWLQNFSDFTRLHQVVAVQGRYLLPVLPLVYIFCGSGFHQALLALRRTYLATANGFSQSWPFLREKGWGRKAASQTLRLMSSLHLL